MKKRNIREHNDEVEEVDDVPLQKQRRGSLHKFTIGQLSCAHSESDSSYEDSNQSDVEDDVFDDCDEELEEDDDEAEDEEERKMRLFPELKYWVP